MITIDSLTILAQSVPPEGTPPPNPLGPFIPLIFIGIIFYFLLIRPQQKKQKEHQRLVDSLKTGDKIVTSGGIHGLIANVKDRTVIVKVADNVKIELEKASVTTVAAKEE